MSDFTLRDATPDDAPALLRYMRDLLSEPNHNMRRDTDEFTHTVEEEADFIRQHNQARNSCLVLATAPDGSVIGVLTCTGGTLRAEKHVTELSISVDAAWRGRGIGAAMMQYAVDWARSTGIIRRVALFVFARHRGAIALYERFGFQVEGRLRDELYREGKYLDTLLMSLLLD